MTKAELRALELGFVPSRPLFDTRYDMILDNGKQLYRVQVKYANGVPSQSSGSIVVNLSYETRKHEVFTYKKSEVDGLIVYLPKTDKLCYIPLELFIGKKNLCLRLEKPKNNQKNGIIFAEDYYW